MRRIDALFSAPSGEPGEEEALDAGTADRGREEEELEDEAEADDLTGEKETPLHLNVEATPAAVPSPAPGNGGSVLRHVDTADGGGPSPAAVTPELEAFLDREAVSRMQSRVCWKYLEACFKWRLILTYLKERGVEEGSPRAQEVRGLLARNQLRGVEYDSLARRVVRLNYSDL